MTMRKRRNGKKKKILIGKFSSAINPKKRSLIHSFIAPFVAVVVVFSLFIATSYANYVRCCSNVYISMMSYTQIHTEKERKRKNTK